MNGPIGLFDSGVGGLTVARALARELPNESLLYFGDTAHLPYGDKSPETIRTYSRRIAQRLLDQGAKAIVIACNSASSVAYEELAATLPVPVINVIDPVIERLAKKKAHRVSVWGTRATIGSGVYAQRLSTELPDCAVQSLATPLLAPVIEESLLKGDVTDAVIAHYLNSTDFASEHLVLACTHYPLIASQIAQHLPDTMKLMRVPTVVAKHVHHVLADHNLLADGSQTPEHRFEVSDYTESFERIAGKFFGRKVKLVVRS